jgi:hypothetical protein
MVVTLIVNFCQNFRRKVKLCSHRSILPQTYLKLNPQFSSENSISLDGHPGRRRDDRPWRVHPLEAVNHG